jgi:hypothetical protein
MMDIGASRNRRVLPVAYAGGWGGGSRLLMTGFGGDRCCLLLVGGGKFRGMLRMRDDFLLHHDVTMICNYNGTLASSDLVVLASSAQVAKSSYSVLTEVWIVS